MIRDSLKALFARLRPVRPKPARRGGSEPKATDREGLLIRICERIDVDPVSGCWNWTGAVDADGYPQLRIDGRVMRVGRVVLMLAGAAFKRGDRALHHCDRPSCCRPDHLFVGTDRENAAEKMRKGRHRRRSVISDDAARAIYSAAGTHAEIAQRFGVSRQTVSNIKTGRTRWRVHGR